MPCQPPPFAGRRGQAGEIVRRQGRIFQSQPAPRSPAGCRLPRRCDRQTRRPTGHDRPVAVPKTSAVRKRVATQNVDKRLSRSPPIQVQVQVRLDAATARAKRRMARGRSPADRSSGTSWTAGAAVKAGLAEKGMTAASVPTRRAIDPQVDESHRTGSLYRCAIGRKRAPRETGPAAARHRVHRRLHCRNGCWIGVENLCRGPVLAGRHFRTHPSDHAPAVVPRSPCTSPPQNDQTDHREHHRRTRSANGNPTVGRQFFHRRKMACSPRGKPIFCLEKPVFEGYLRGRDGATDGLACRSSYSCFPLFPHWYSLQENKEEKKRF